MGALPSRLRIHITLPLGTWCAIVVSCSSEFGTVVWYKEAPMPKHEIITKRPTLRMNDSHNELETKAEHDEGGGSASPRPINEPAVFPAREDHDQQLVSNNPAYRAAVD